METFTGMVVRTDGPQVTVRDPAGRSGLASLTADMLEEGAGDLDAMQFADHSEVELERLQSERALERKRSASL